MELQHIDAPRRLVQAVDVLGDHRFQLAGALQLRQLQVGRVGLHIGTDQLVPVEAEKFLRPFFKKGVAEHGLRRVVVLLVVQPVHAAEVGDTALSGHPRPAEEDDAVAFVDPIL